VSSVGKMPVRRVVVAFLFVAFGVCGILSTPMAGAAPVPGEVIESPLDLSTDLVVAALEQGTDITGGIEPVGFDPFAGYPAAPTPGASVQTNWAGTLRVQETVEPFRTALVYCIDLTTSTYVGIHYNVGDWTEANVPNLGFVQYILTHYFPFVAGEPAAAPNDVVRAAAIQAAIWYFTDRYVLAADAPVRSYTQAIVDDALANGPASEPAPPNLDLVPDHLRAPDTGDIVGPLVVDGDVSGTLTEVNELEVFRDAAGTQPVTVGSTVSPGDRLWVRSSPSGAQPPPEAGIQISAQAVFNVGVVLLYDESNPGVDSAQKLVLAQERTLTVNVAADVEIYPAGQLQVTKTIGGTGAGYQGLVTIDVDCDDPEDAFDRTFTIDAATPAGSQALPLISGIPVDTTCTVSESANGDNELVNSSTPVLIEPAEVVIGHQDIAQVSVTNTYERAVGGLTVTKVVRGPGAGQQSAVTLRLDCNDRANAFDRAFTLPGGLKAGTYPQKTVTGIPAGTTCTVTETADGRTDRVTPATPTVAPATVTIVDSVITPVTVTNTYDRVIMLPVTSGAALPPGPAALAATALILAGAGLLVLYRRSRRRGPTSPLP
jgi:Domain of unknown function (DUF5979)/Thioester domain